MKRSMIALQCAALVAGAAMHTQAAAQEAPYPNRPVRLLIGFPIGGLLETVSRVVGERMSVTLGQPFIVEPRPGASGVIATGALAKAPPDGYTLMMINDNHAINPGVIKDLPYDSLKDFAPIGFVGSTPLVFNVPPSLGVKTMAELVALAKARNGALSYASVGTGSLPHLTTEVFTLAAGVKMNHVPYKGGGPALVDLIGGHVDSMLSSIVVSRRHNEAGKLTPLAVAARQRLEVLPNVPTMAEAGYPVEAAYWFGLMAPAATPAAVLGRLEGALAEALARPEVRGRLTDMGAIVTPLDGKGFGAYIRAETEKWVGAIRKANLKFD